MPYNHPQMPYGDSAYDRSYGDTYSILGDVAPLTILPTGQVEDLTLIVGEGPIAPGISIIDMGSFEVEWVPGQGYNIVQDFPCVTTAEQAFARIRHSANENGWEDRFDAALEAASAAPEVTFTTPGSPIPEYSFEMPGLKLGKKAFRRWITHTFLPERATLTGMIGDKIFYTLPGDKKPTRWVRVATTDWGRE